MLSTDALDVLQERLRAAQLSLETLPVHEGVAAMASFYRDERADDVDLEDDGDMLLVQWGPQVIRGQTSSFVVDVTRQFMSPEQDGEVVQLSLRFSFPLDAGLEEIASDNQWFETPDDVDEVEALVRSREVFEVVARRTDARVTLTFEPT